MTEESWIYLIGSSKAYETEFLKNDQKKTYDETQEKENGKGKKDASRKEIDSSNRDRNEEG